MRCPSSLAVGYARSMGRLWKTLRYVVLIPAWLSVSMGIAGAQPAGVLQRESFTLKAYHGKQRAAERGRLAVPADYGSPGRTFQIVFYRLPARSATSNPPVVFLMGGPGVPASVIAPIPPYFELFNRLAETADVILLDQRGLGESTPKVDCPAPAKPIPADLFESSARLLAAFESVYSECAEHWKPRARGTDFAIE